MANSKKTQNVFICSALNNFNIKKIWKYIYNKYEEDYKSGKIENTRNEQDVIWLKRLINNELMETLNRDSNIKNIIQTLKKNPLHNTRKKILDTINQLKVNFE